MEAQINHYNCIYMYINKINGKKYIGQTIDFNRRHKEHIRHNNYPLEKAMQKYGEENFEIIILKEDIMSQCLLNLFECYYIKKYDTLAKNKKGYNITDGGFNGNPFSGKTEDEIQEWKNKLSEYRTGTTMSEEVKEKIRESARNNDNYGMKNKHHTEETKEKLRKINTGKIISDKTKNKLKITNGGENNGFFGKHHSKETKEKLKKYNSIKIVQCDNNWNIIKIWNSGKEASLTLNIDAATISRCCKGKQKTAGGFKWKYYKEEEK